MDSLSGEIALCTRCVASRGLCQRHARGVLPRLAQPYWYQLVGATPDKTDHQRVIEAMSPEARRVYHRKRVKAARRATMQAARLASLQRLAA